jgi:hypothetical protein
MVNDNTCLSEETDSFQIAANELLKYYKEKFGHAPNDNDFFSIVHSDKYSFTTEEQGRLYKIVIAQQKPSITKEQLISLMKAKTNSINSFHCKYNSDEEIYINGETKRQQYKIEYTIKHNQFLLDEQPIIEKSYVKRSYDGEYLYNLTEQKKNEYVVEKKSKLSDFMIFYRSDCPLGAAKLLNQIPGIKFNLTDIVKFLEDPDVTVYEKKEVINGKECIIVASWSSALYLDTTMEYSLVQAIEYHHHLNNDPIPAFNGRSVCLKRILSDFVQFDNGIWLPKKVSVVIYDMEGNKQIAHSIEASVIEVNKKISDSYFTDFIPDGAIVMDSERNIVYQWGDYPSINGLLKETVKPKSTRLYQRISVITGLIMIVIAIVFEIRKRILQRRGS